MGKVVSSISQSFGLGAGATWPGEIALRLSPNIFAEFASQLRKGIILVAGTNGKTTTSLMITQVLEKQGLTVVHNASGANLLNGIVSACIQEATWSGKLRVDYGVFEVDENSLPIVIKSIKSAKSKVVIVLLNLFRDQLDRYGEVDVIAEKWQKSLQSLESLDRKTRKMSDVTIIANADDPLIAHLGLHTKLPVTYFGINDASKYLAHMEHATDSIFCLNCGARLQYEGVYFSHIGIWKCPTCGEKRPNPTISEWKSPLPGLYNQYNTLAAVAVAKSLHLKPTFKSFKPSFGRQEEIDIDGNIIKIFLSKNPAGFNQSLRTVIELGARQLLLVLNDRIPDGRDVSWIWDVDFEMIPKHVSVLVSGDRVYDLALRLKYAGITYEIYELLEEALKRSHDNETLYILPTYSAMLEVRKRLRGRKIL